MQLSSETRTAQADNIHDTGDHLFWSGNSDDSLINSIREFGQMTPVLACDTDQGMELVAGHGRLAALRQLDELVLVRMVTVENDIEKGLLYLADNAERTIDDGMRLAALNYFHALMDKKAVQSDILPRLGVKPKSKDAKLLMAWLDLPDNWQDHLAAGHVPLAAGTPLTRMDQADKDAVEPLFANVSWSRSNAVNMLTWLFETSKMKGTPVADVIQNAGLDDIMRQGLSPKDAIAKFTAAAKAARYPELSALQNTFAKAARELTAGTKWRVTQPNNFETGGAELSIQVKDAKALEKAVNELESMAGLSSWQELWNLGGKND